MRKQEIKMLLVAVIVGLAFQALLSSCVTTQEVKKDYAPVFYPPAPELPRYQFLTSFQGSGDFKDKKTGLDAFLGGGSGAGYTLRKPFGVIMQRGSIYVADTQATVFKFDLVNRKFGSLEGAKGLGKLVQPVNVSMDDQGNTYVCDPIRRQVIMYDNKDFFLKSFSNPKPWKPVDAEVFDGQLFVADSTRGTGGVVVFDLKSGEIIEKIGNSGPIDHRLKISTNLAIDSEGYLYVMDAGRFQVVKFDRDGHYRGHLGDAGDSLGHFGRPRGVAVDREGRIYAVDAAYDIVQVFADSGQVLTFFGGSGGTPGSMTLPAGVHIDYEQAHIDLFRQFIAPDFNVEYLILVTSQFNKNNAVNVYGYGKRKGVRYKTDHDLYDELRERFKNEQEVQ